MDRVYFVAYIAYLVLIVSLVFFDRRKPVQRFSWILVLVFLPFIGLFVYLFVGSDSLLEFRKRRLRRQRGKDLAAIEQAAWVGSCCREAPLSKAQLFHDEYCGSTVSTGNQVKVYTSGTEKYRHLFRDMRRARSHIHVQYFSIHNDVVGRELTDILCQKAEQGVEVKLLYDSVGCLFNFIQPLLGRLRQAGVSVANIRPQAWDVNYRNHRKIVVVDGRIGYTGGMNIGVKYQYGVRNTPWRDTHLRIVGGAVAYLQQVFLSDWVSAVKDRNACLRYAVESYFPRGNPDAQGVSAQVVANGLYMKHKNDDMINLSYFTILSRANRRVWIQTPYFSPSELILQTLRTLASAGVEVRIMTSSAYAFGDLFHRSITNYFLRYLVDSGVRVFKYKGVLHAKTLLIDSESLSIGTVNLNVRSLLRDDELYVYFESRQLADEYEKNWLADLENAEELDYTEFVRQRFTSRAVESALSFFWPVS